jgi:hypothetical protein
MPSNDSSPAQVEAQVQPNQGFGPPVNPKYVKQQETGQGLPESVMRLISNRIRDLIGVERRPTGKQSEEFVRVNPLWVPLEEVPREWLLNGRKGAVWHYSVVEDDNGKDRVMLGSEELLTVVTQEQFDDLLAGMQEAFRRQQKRQPWKKTKDLTAEDLRKAINGQGHPTIAVRFTSDGRTVQGAAKVSGEFRYDPERELGVVNDRSGRYMSKKVRPSAQPEEVAVWGENAAGEFRKHLKVDVVFEQIKTSADPPAIPTIAKHAKALQPTGNSNTTTDSYGNSSARTPGTAPGAPSRPAPPAVTPQGGDVSKGKGMGR